ncbi:MAG TPA: PAS domain-containing protein [Herpetosiphonaceae bacterium]
MTDHPPPAGSADSPAPDIADLERRLAAEIERREAAERAQRLTMDTLLRGPFVIFRWIAAEGWPVEFVSDNVSQVFGYSAEDFTSGRVPFASVIHPDDLARVGGEVGSYSEQGVPTFEQEYRIVRRDGAVIWIYDFTAVIRDGAGAITHYYGYVLDITARKRVEEEQVALHQQIIEAQQASLQELSTPLIPITDNAVIMPLIGAIDSRRAQLILEEVLRGVARHQAAIAILDITGVQIVDTQVAQTLVQAAQAARLLGTQVILTGVRPEVAQTLVHLGADLQGIITLNNLQAGIAVALQPALSPGARRS